MSGENLRVGKKPVKKNAFVSLRAGSSDQCCETKMSVEGGSNPTWSEKLVLDLPALHAGFLTLEVHCKAASGNKLVGGARVPVADIFGGFVPVNHLQFLSYRLWDATSERNGIINISVRVKSPEPYRSSQALQPKTFGIPAKEEKRLDSVVTGVPAVWFGRHCTY
ncbi:hypothetical protein CDL15_Pgr018768 [Punica granatum]|nr:hypothetical protein CDL15_Pgr018768 [Punica granatum]